MGFKTLEWMKKKLEGQVVELPSLLGLVIIFVFFIALTLLVTIFSRYTMSQQVAVTSNTLSNFQQRSYTLHRMFNYPIDNNHTFYVRCRDKSGHTDSARLPFAINVSQKVVQPPSKQEKSLAPRILSVSPTLGKIVNRPAKKWWQIGIQKLKDFVGLPSTGIDYVYDQDSQIEFVAVTEGKSSCKLELAVCNKRDGNVKGGCIDQTEEKKPTKAFGFIPAGPASFGGIKSLKKPIAFTQIQAEADKGEDRGQSIDNIAGTLRSYNTLIFTNSSLTLEKKSGRGYYHSKQVDLEDFFYQLLRQEHWGPEIFGVFSWVDQKAQGLSPDHLYDNKAFEISTDRRHAFKWFYRFNCTNQEQSTVTNWGPLQLGEEEEKEEGQQLRIKTVNFSKNTKVKWPDGSKRRVVGNYTSEMVVITNRRANCMGGFYPTQYQRHSFGLSSQLGYIQQKNFTFNDRYAIKNQRKLSELIRDWLRCKRMREQGNFNFKDEENLVMDSDSCPLLDVESAEHQLREELFDSLRLDSVDYHHVQIFDAEGDKLPGLSFKSSEEPIGETLNYVAPLSLPQGDGKVVLTVGKRKQVTFPNAG